MIGSTRRALAAQLRTVAHRDNTVALRSRAVAISAGLYCVVVAAWGIAIAPHTPPATLPIQLLGVVALFAVLAGATGLWLSATGPSPQRPPTGPPHEGWAVIRRVYRHRAHHAMVNLDITVPGNTGTCNRTIGCAHPDRYHPGIEISVIVDSPACTRVLLGDPLPH